MRDWIKRAGKAALHSLVVASLVISVFVFAGINLYASMFVVVVALMVVEVLMLCPPVSMKFDYAVWSFISRLSSCAIIILFICGVLVLVQLALGRVVLVVQ